MKPKIIGILLSLMALSMAGCVGPIGYVKDLIQDHKNASLQAKEVAASKIEVQTANNALASAKTALAGQSATIANLQSRDSTIQWDTYGTVTSLGAQNYPLATTFATDAYNGFGTPLTPDQAKQVEAIVSSVQDAATAKIQEVQAQADATISAKNAQISQQNTAIVAEVAATKIANDKFVAASTLAATTGTKLETITKQNTLVLQENTGLKADLSKVTKSIRNTLIFFAFIWVFMAWIMPGINKLCETIPALAPALIVTVPLNELFHLILSGLHYILGKVEVLFQKKLAAAIPAKS